MDAEALLRMFYKRTADTVTPPQNDETDVLDWLNEAQREAAVRAHLLFDNSTPAITTYAVAGNTSSIVLSALVLHVESAKFTPDSGGRARYLDAVGLDWIEDREEQFLNSVPTCSYPEKFAHLENRKLRLWPTPTQAGTLQLTVYRKPIRTLEDDADVPEIADEHHEGLIDWLEHRCYSQRDAEFYDQTRADRALASFESRFGKRRSASSMRRHRERRRVTTRCV